MSVRPAAVANLFYPGDARELERMIHTLLADAAPAVTQPMPNPEAIIVPHAGYIYSGLTAAFAYATLNRTSIRRVAVFGPAHRVAFHGMAVPSSSAFATPLGAIPIDHDLLNQVRNLPGVEINDDAHAEEHALEVQLPFLQVVLNDFSLLPICIGLTDPAPVAAAIELIRGEAETLIIISSDLSHYHPYSEARRRDLATIEQIRAMQPPLDHQQACGATGINAMLSVARRHQLDVSLLDYRNSGDTAGDKQRVVGYSALALDQREQP